MIKILQTTKLYDVYDLMVKRIAWESYKCEREKEKEKIKKFIIIIVFDTICMGS